MSEQLLGERPGGHTWTVDVDDTDDDVARTDAAPMNARVRQGRKVAVTALDIDLLNARLRGD